MVCSLEHWVEDSGALKLSRTEHSAVINYGLIHMHWMHRDNTCATATPSLTYVTVCLRRIISGQEGKGLKICLYKYLIVAQSLYLTTTDENLKLRKAKSFT